MVPHVPVQVVGDTKIDPKTRAQSLKRAVAAKDAQTAAGRAVSASSHKMPKVLSDLLHVQSPSQRGQQLPKEDIFAKLMVTGAGCQVTDGTNDPDIVRSTSANRRGTILETTNGGARQQVPPSSFHLVPLPPGAEITEHDALPDRCPSAFYHDDPTRRPPPHQDHRRPSGFDDPDLVRPHGCVGARMLGGCIPGWGSSGSGSAQWKVRAGGAFLAAGPHYTMLVDERGHDRSAVIGFT
eukprot:1581909-Rhodomonas_salina.3